MTKPAHDANPRWPGLLLAALVVALVMFQGAGTASVATATAAQTRVGAHILATQILVEPHGGIGAGQRLGNDFAYDDFVGAIGVAAKSGPAASNYRGRHNGDLAARGAPRLPKDRDAHHRVPQMYRDPSDSAVRNPGASGAGIEDLADWIDIAFEGFFWH